MVCRTVVLFFAYLTASKTTEADNATPPTKVCIPKKWVWLKKKKLAQENPAWLLLFDTTLLVAEQTRVAALIIRSDALRCATLCLLWLQGYVPGRSVPTPAVGRCNRTRTPTQRLTKSCPLWWQYLSSSSNSKWSFTLSYKKCEMISSTASCLARSAQNKYWFYSSVNLKSRFFFFSLRVNILGHILPRLLVFIYIIDFLTTH